MRLFAFLACAASDRLCVSCICFAASGGKWARHGSSYSFKDAWSLLFGYPEHRVVPPWMDGGSVFGGPSEADPLVGPSRGTLFKSIQGNTWISMPIQLMATFPINE